MHLLDGGVVRLRDGAVVRDVALRRGRSLARGRGVLARAHGRGEELHLPRGLGGSVLRCGDDTRRLRLDGRARPARDVGTQARRHRDAHALVRLLELLLEDLALLLGNLRASRRVRLRVSQRLSGCFVGGGSRRSLLRGGCCGGGGGACALALGVEVGPGGGPVLLEPREFRRESFSLGSDFSLANFLHRERRVPRGFELGLFRGRLGGGLRGALLSLRQELTLGLRASGGGFGARRLVLGGV